MYICTQTLGGGGSKDMFASEQCAIPVLNRVINWSQCFLEQQMSTGSLVLGNDPAGLTLRLLNRYE